MSPRRTVEFVIHVDTSFLIRALVKGSPEGARMQVWLRDKTELGMSAVAWAEYSCGPRVAEPAEVEERQYRLIRQVISHWLPLDPEAASEAASLFNRTGRRRGSLADCMIAATALRSNAPLATSDPDDFQRFVPFGLEVLTAGGS